MIRNIFGTKNNFIFVNLSITVQQTTNVVRAFSESETVYFRTGFSSFFFQLISVAFLGRRTGFWTLEDRKKGMWINSQNRHWFTFSKLKLCCGGVNPSRRKSAFWGHFHFKLHSNWWIDISQRARRIDLDVIKNISWENSFVVHYGRMKKYYSYTINTHTLIWLLENPTIPELGRIHCHHSSFHLEIICKCHYVKINTQFKLRICATFLMHCCSQVNRSYT